MGGEPNISNVFMPFEIKKYTYPYSKNNNIVLLELKVHTYYLKSTKIFYVCTFQDINYLLIICNINLNLDW